MRVPDRFVVRRRLGSGAFGEVFEAEDRLRGERVALKHLSKIEDRTVFRFKREFRLVQEVVHENLVRLHELLIEEGEHWLVMELVSGRSFLEYVRGKDDRLVAATPTSVTVDLDDEVATASGPLVDLVRLRAVFVQLVRGVSALHAAQMIHRDLKPENVLVDAHGRLKILDFGIATSEREGASRLSGIRAGTPRYMAPECLRHEGEGASEASDWYSVGVMLFEALTARAPAETVAPEKLVETEPLRELGRLALDLVAADPTKRPNASAILRALDVPVDMALPSRETFVGRERELALLEGALDETRAGNLVTVLLHGASGVGKTTLVGHFLERARAANAIVLEGRCHPNESLPFNAIDGFIDALAQRLEAMPRLEREAVMPRDARLLQEAFPVLASALATAPKRPVAANPLEARRRALVAMRELVARISDRRLLVIHLDDVHWGDADSAAMLDELLRAPDPPPVLLIATHRDAEEGGASPMLHTLHRIAESQRAHDIPLAPLDEEAADLLARQLLEGETKLRSEAIAAASGGNPLVIQLLARAHDARPDVSPSSHEAISSAVAHWISRLPASCSALLDVCVVANAPFSPEVLSRAARLSLADTHAAITTLLDERLVRRSASGDASAITIVHDRIRTAASERLAVEAKTAIHHAIGLALEATTGDAEATALHFRAAGDAAKTHHHARTAAERALASFAFHRAASFFEIAIATAPSNADTSVLETALGDARTFAGRAVDAADAYLAAAARVDDRAFAIELRRRAAQQLLFAGRFDRGLEEMRAVLEAVGLSLHEGRAGAIAGLLFHRAVTRVRGALFSMREKSTTPPEDLLRIDVCRSATIGLGLVDVVRSAELQARHLLLALQAGEPTRVARALGFEVLTSAAGGNGNRARTHELFDELDVLVARLDSEELRGVAAAVRGGVAYLEGDFAQVPILMAKADPLFSLSPTEIMHYGHDSARVVWLGSLHWLGRYREMVNEAEEALVHADERKNVYVTTYLQTGIHAITRLAVEGLPIAEARAREAIAPWPTDRFDVPHVLDGIGRAELALARDEASVAYEIANATARAARRAFVTRCQYFRTNIRETTARATLAFAKASSGSRRAELLREARQHARALVREGLDWATACAALVEAGCDALDGRAEDAAQLLIGAAETFRRLEMMMHASAARRRAGQPETSDAFTKEGVLDPELLLRVLTPGIS